MKVNNYTKDVLRFAGGRPYINDGGSKINLNQRTAFSPAAVLSDGVGNIIDMPQLRRKPCFARPERFFRGAEEEAKVTGDSVFIPRCARCNVVDACSEIVIERIESSPAIENAYCDWEACADLLPFKKKFTEPIARRKWVALQTAIIRHGGWTSSNDAAIAANNIAVEAAKRKAVRERNKANRLARRASRLGPMNRWTPEFAAAAEIERDHRCAIIMGLRDKTGSPAMLMRLSEAGCRRTADMWLARTVLTSFGIAITGKEVARWLVQEGRGGGLPEPSLATRYYVDAKRIDMLESDAAGAPVWSPFSFESKHAGGQLTL